MRARIFCLWIVLLVGSNGPLSAQVVRGRFIDSSAGTPVEGGIIAVLDRGGHQVGRALTDSTGWFALVVGAPGEYHIRASRIGYEDVVTPPFTVQVGDVAERNVVASVRPILLERIAVRGRARCHTRPEQGEQTQALWTAIRAALAADVVTEAGKGLRYDIVEYRGRRDPTTMEGLTRPQTVTRDGVAVHPFVSAPADELVTHGFVGYGIDSTSYFAPDAAVLLSDAFLQSHCFSVVAPEDGVRDVIGLAFRPIHGRRLPDVEGTLWVNLASAQLEYLDYNYTGLRAPQIGNVGGRVAFSPVGSGRWIVSDWYVRMPLVPRVYVEGHLSRDPLPSERHAKGVEIIEEGGFVLRARDRVGNVVYEPNHSSTQLLAGRGLVPDDRVAQESASNIRKDSSAGANCPDSLSARGRGAIEGAVLKTDEPHTALTLPTVVVEWTGWTLVGPLDGALGTRKRVTAVADVDGNYVVCGLPLGVMLSVYAIRRSRKSSVRRITLRGAAPFPLDLDISARPAASGRSAESSRAGGLRVNALTGRVVDAVTHRPLPGVRVVVYEGADSAGASKSTVTQADGSFLFEHVELGDHLLLTEYLGYERKAEVVHVQQTSGARVAVELMTQALPLEEIVVEGHGRSELGGFYLRRSQNMGTFFDEDDIGQLSPHRLSDLMRHIPGVQVICPGVSLRCGIRMAAAAASLTDSDCPVEYFVDGSLAPRGFEIDDLMTTDIRAVEVYSHASTIPARFSIGVSARCGVIVLWTRGGPPHE